MRNLIFTIFLLLSICQSQAQFLRADYKKAMELKHRPLIVALFDMEEEAGTYCDSIHMAWYNEHIRELFAKHWTLSDSIIFMKSRRVASFIAAKSHDYVIFSGGPSREGQQSSGDIFWLPSFTFMLYLSEDGKRFDSKMVDRGLYSEPLVPDMELTGQLFRGKYIFKLSFADLSLSDNDLIFTIRYFNSEIKEALKNKKPKSGIYAKKIPKEVTAKLREKTLLIPNNLDPEGVNEKTVGRYYKNPFRLVSQEDLVKSIVYNEKNTAYLHYMWSDHERMYQGVVIDAETSKVLAVFRPGAIKIRSDKCPPAGTSYRNRISMKVKRLKSIN